ncbi:hypothetical protein JCM5350_004785 [Sporobolomyces pararoseus]
MSHYRPFADSPSSSSTLRPPSSSSSRPFKEERTIRERIDILLERLDRTKQILIDDCSKGDRFGLLALGTLERNLKELVPVIKLIEQSRISGKEEEEVRAKQVVKEETSRLRKEEEERPRSRSNAPSVIQGPRADAPQSTTKKGRTTTLDNDNDDEFTVERVLPPPTSVSPASRPLPLSRPGSTISPSESSTNKIRLVGEPSSTTTRSSITKFFNRAKETVSPPSKVLSTTRPQPTKDEEEEEEEVGEGEKVKSLERGVDRKDRHRRRVSVASDSSTSAPALNSRDQLRTIKALSDDDDKAAEDLNPKKQTSRSHSRVPSRNGRNAEVQRALEMASAPPRSSEDSPSRDTRRRGRKQRFTVVRLNEENVIKTIAKESDQTTKFQLLLVSKTYQRILEPIVYSRITVGSIDQVEKLSRTFESNSVLANLVKSLEITPLDSSSSTSSRSRSLSNEDPQSLLEPLQQLVSLLPNLKDFKEDFTKSDWDVSEPSLYPLSLTSPTCQIKSFTSKRCWWEIGALYELFTHNTDLVQVVLGGAAMDRDWEGTKLKSTLLNRPPNSQIESLEVAQIMHEDTLSVLSLLSRNPLFKTLRISFQSIGPSDDDTPLSSIPSSIKLIGSTLNHLTLIAPNQVSTARVSEDTSILLEEVLTCLPNLITLEFQETFNEDEPNDSVPIVSSKIFGGGGGGELGLLSKKLKTLRARELFSITTRDVLRLLERDPELIPVLEELDLEWASSKETEVWYDEREAVKIRKVCEEYGIKCYVGKGKREFTIG